MSYTLKNLDEKYVLYGRVQDDTDVLGKREPFDASHLLKQPRYIKASDHQLIDLEHEPIKKLDWGMAFTIRERLPDSPKFASIKQLSLKNLEESMKDKVHWEYLYSGFSFGNTKKPDYDDFRLYLTIDGQEHQMLLMRRILDNEYVYMLFDKVSENTSALTYAKYLAQQEGQK